MVVWISRALLDAESDGEAVTSGVEAATALGYVLRHPRMQAVIAYHRADERDFVRQSGFGCLPLVADLLQCRPCGGSPSVSCEMTFLRSFAA